LCKIIATTKWSSPGVKREALALSWDDVDVNKRVAHVRRTVALGKVEERTKTAGDRPILLNERALHALEFAKHYAQRRSKGA
ncbi:hypothetical protein SB770_34605, partial [Pseudomonas sp. SIMBA_044]